MSDHSDSSWEDFDEEDVAADGDGERGAGAVGPRQDRTRSNSENLNELKCGCCFELMVDPTTLDCGHNFCRTCLAMWWQNQNKQTCPECRQIWVSSPLINYALRSIIERNCPEQVKERRSEVEGNPEKQSALSQFNQVGEQHRRRIRTRAMRGGGQGGQPAEGPQALLVPANQLVQQLRGLGEDRQVRQLGRYLVRAIKTCCGLSLALFVFTLLYRVLNFVGGAYDKRSMLALKPVSRWSTSDVSLWLDQAVGEWTRPYQDRFRVNGVNGPLLLTLEDAELQGAPFLVGTDSHRATILGHVDILQSTGMKKPGDLWEFRSLYEGLTLFFLWMFVDSPRLGIFLLYLFYYDELFLHFINATCAIPGAPDESNQPHSSAQVYPSTDLTPTWEQEASFVAKFLFLPYLLFIQFIWQWIGRHYVIGALGILGSIGGTISEAYIVVQTWQRGLGALRGYLLAYLQVLAGLALCVLIWPLLPAPLASLSFYWMLVTSLLLAPLREFFMQRGTRLQHQHQQQHHGQQAPAPPQPPLVPLEPPLD